MAINMPEPKTAGVKLECGRHVGVLITRVPVSYLKWMVNVSHVQADCARAELKRRGTNTPELDISGHAIDRASLYCLREWRLNARENEGLNSWLIRICTEALERARTTPKIPLTEEEKRKGGRESYIIHNGLKLVFEFDNAWPVLKTVYPDSSIYLGLPDISAD